jgi:phage/plasmid-associated DNA primase
MTLQDHKGLHLLFQDIYDCPDVRQDVRQKVRKTYDDFNKFIEEALIESGKMMRDPAYKEAARVILQNIGDIPLIENEIPLISWEDASSQNPPLAHHVLDKRHLVVAAESLGTYIRINTTEDFLSNYCPTWKRWMNWNGHKIGEYDSVGCFFMWLWKLCGTDYSKTMREIFYLVGPGRTGNTSVANAIEAFLKPITCTVDPDAGEFANAGYIDKRFGIIPENKKTRSSGSAIIKSLSGGDVLKINQKHQAAYTARVHLVMLSLNNENPMINLYDNSEYSRTYVLHTRRPVDKGQPEAAANSETIVSQYHKEMYPLLAYCKYLFQEHIAMNADLILRKPEDMERIIVDYCLTQGSGYLKKYEAYAETTEKSKFRWIQIDEFITHVVKYNTESEDPKIRKEVLAAIKSGVLRKRFRLHHAPAGNGDLYIYAPGASNRLYKSFSNNGNNPDAKVIGQIPFEFEL